MTLDLEARWCSDCSRTVSCLAMGAEVSRVGAAAGSPIAYSMRRRRASRRSMVSVAVLSKELSMVRVL